MSGDVQPRKRKDKKKKKDDLGIEEPRGTAAALGEGDIFMHSPHEHGTGGNWCAKVIFFSLLAVLVTLIGLIILENRGLSELEANSVESKYSGVLEGWLEDAHDDHHDEHTLDLNHHDDEDDDDHSGGLDHGDEVEHDDDDDDEEQNHEDEENDHDEDENEDDDDDDDEDKIDQEENNDEDSQEVNDDSQEAYDDGDQNEDSEEQNLETAEEDEIEERNYRRYYQSIENQANDDNDDDDDDDDDLQKIDDDDDNDDDQSVQNDDEDDQEDNDDSQENNDFEDEQDQVDNNDEDDNEDSIENYQNEAQENEDEDEHEEEDSDVEVEHIEKEVFDDDVSTEAPEPEEDKSEEVSDEASFPADEADEDDVEFLEPGDLDDLPDELPIPLPKGKPLAEMEDTTTETPQDTLADEEEYERQQEALRREKEQASQGMWLKLVVGGALLVATQAVLRRATGPREPEDEVDTTREGTPLSDRRMTLIAEPVAPPVIPKPQEVSRPKEVVREAPVVKSAPPPPPEDDEELEEEEEEIVVTKGVGSVGAEKDFVDKELYSDEEEAEDEEEEEEEIIEEKKEPPKPTSSKPATPIKEPPKPTGLKPAAPIKEPPKPTGLKPAAPIKELPKPPVKETLKPIEKKETLKPAEKAPTPEEEYEDDDVEIIEDEDIGEEVEEEEDDISDVDDAELLTRLEAKYGRLPEPERPGRKMEGGNSVEDEWAGEPGDALWRDELERAERDLRQGEWAAAAKRASAAALRSSARARYTAARALDAAAEAKRDNGLLTKAIAAYLELLKMNERLSDEKLMEVASRALDRIQFRGNYLGAEPIYRLLIRRFPDDPTHRNNLTVSFLMANRVDLAEEVIKETLSRWPSDRTALAHHGFILKTLHNRHEEAVKAFTKALEGDTGPANEPRFYYHLGDSLLLLGRFKEAHEVHKRGATLGHFLSPAQRSLYNVDRLKSKPWWNVEQTPYNRLARALEKSWMEILKEGRAAQELYENEKEGLKERGEWSQLDLFVRGREVPGRCSRAPVTCNIVRSEAAASGCRRGQVKFSSLGAGAHIRPHVGPTNCRLRMHLGLSNTKDTYIRVDQETRQWQTGKVLLFDDSFEHEVWHNGSGARLVLVVDVWHPDLTHNERRQLPAI